MTIEANYILDLAEEAAERRHLSGIAIESLSDTMLPPIDNAGIAANVQQVFEDWAYTYLDALQGGVDMDKLDRSDAEKLLSGLPLAKYFDIL